MKKNLGRQIKIPLRGAPNFNVIANWSNEQLQIMWENQFTFCTFRYHQKKWLSMPNTNSGLVSSFQHSFQLKLMNQAQNVQIWSYIRHGTTPLYSILEIVLPNLPQDSWKCSSRSSNNWRTRSSSPRNRSIGVQPQTANIRDDFQTKKDNRGVMNLVEHTKSRNKRSLAVESASHQR